MALRRPTLADVGSLAQDFVLAEESERIGRTSLVNGLERPGVLLFLPIHLLPLI